MRMHYSPDQLHDVHSFLFTSYVTVPFLLLRLLIIGSVSTMFRRAMTPSVESSLDCNHYRTTFSIYRSYLNLRS